LATISSGLILKPDATVSSGLTSKPAATVSAGLASKLAAIVFSGLASKPVVTDFSSLALKLVVTISHDLASKSVVIFLVKPQNHGGGGFPSLGLKTGSYSLVPRQFLGLGLKTIRTSVCRLCHKTDGWRSTRDKHRDLVACFTWKQVLLGFPSLT
jgi:hypothetical protein